MRPVDPFGAFCDYGPLALSALAEGPLDGLRFGVKDLFDIAGVPTGAGSPEWLATHPIPTTTAPAVEALLAAGATCVGKTHTDELAWSLNGQNHHYGTPRNMAAPGRIPGGSSSGSAAATAAGLVDFALGSDTGGSVRLPASFCGLYGLRSTHGRVPLAGAVPLAPSYDTVGWFARDPAVFARVGSVLLADARPATPITRLVWAEDLFGLAGAPVLAALRPSIARIEAIFGKAEAVDLSGGELTQWRDAFRVIQSEEAWRAHGRWITTVKPVFGPGVRERFEAAAQLDPAEVIEARALRERVRQRLMDLIPLGTLVLAPSAPGIAPLLSTIGRDLDDFRSRALALLCAAGHAGLPQVSLPLGHIAECPLGLAMIAAPGEDETLLDLACRMAAAEAV